MAEVRRRWKFYNVDEPAIGMTCYQGVSAPSEDEWVVPAAAADRLAEALGSALGYISADLDDSVDGPQAEAICNLGRAALASYSGENDE